MIKKVHIAMPDSSTVPGACLETGRALILQSLHDEISDI